MSAQSRFGVAALVDRVLHDVKQPLNQIRVVAQDLRIDVQKERLAVDSLPASMREIEEAVDEAVIRIERLKSFADPARRPFLVPAQDSQRESPIGLFDLTAVCRTVLERAQRDAPELEFSAALEPDVWLDTAEPRVIAPAVWELIQNARDAGQQAERNRRRISLSLTRQGSYAVVRVRDNGSGVAPEHASVIFEPFFTTREGASGLGLALVRAVVSDAGGRVDLVKSDEAGSEFEIVLPNASKGTPG